MKKESLFRATAAALFVTGVSISGYHRRKADKEGGEEVSLREEGLPTVIALRGSGLAFALSLTSYVLNPRWMRWSSLELPSGIRWAGAGIGAATLPIHWWIFESIGKNITPTVETREKHELVTNGPYRWVRHPLYTSGFTFFLSLSLVAANWFMGLASLSALLLILARLPKEEEKLIERFGDEYREYMKRTGALVPRLKARDE